jgi:hypothetical protein
MCYEQGEGAKIISGPGGRRKSLKRLETDKEIPRKSKENQAVSFDGFCGAMARLG